MQEHIVAVFDSSGPAAAAQSALEKAGIPTSAIRRYEAGASGASNTNSVANQDYATARPVETSSSGGGFWAWLLGEEGPSVSSKSDYGHHPDVYDRRISAGNIVLAVTVADDSRIHDAVDIIESYNPIEIDEHTDEDAASTTSMAADTTASSARSDFATDDTRMSGTVATGRGPAGTVGEDVGRAAATSTSSGRDETIPLAEEQLEVGKRTVDRGTTRIRRYVFETPVEREVTLRGERVTIERRRPTESQFGQATTGRPGAGAFEERTVEVHETEEVPVVEKTARVAEEVVVHREGTERTETVRDTVRREEVEVTPDRQDAATDTRR